MTGIHRKPQCIAKDKNGSIALEFAIMLPIYLSLLLLIISISKLGVAHVSLQEKATSLTLEFSDLSRAQQPYITALDIRTKLIELGAASTGMDLDKFTVVETSHSTSAFKVFQITQSHQTLLQDLDFPLFNFFNHSSFSIYLPIEQDIADE